MELLRKYSQNPQFAKNLVSKALTGASASGGPLAPQILERLITNVMVGLAPEIAMITPKLVSGKYSEFNRITALPGANGVMGDAATTPVTQASYVRTGRNLKVLRRKGVVTQFLQDASRDYIDVVAQEQENQLQSHVFDFNTLLYFGNENCDGNQWTGLDSLIGAAGGAIAQNRVNTAYGGAVPATLAILDAMIDNNTRKQGARHRKTFLMSPEMLSLFSRILSNVRMVQNQAGNGLSSIEINGGWRLQAYRNVPIIESRLCRPQSQMGAITLAGAGGGSGLGGVGTMYFMASAVTWDGETLASPEVNLAVGTYDKVTISWSASGAVAGAFKYKIYYGSATTGEKLVLEVPYQLYDGNGSPQDQVISVQISNLTANPTIVQMNGVNVGSAATLGGIVPTITTSVGNAQKNDVPLTGTLAAPMEQIFFWDLDEIQGMGRFAYTNTEGSRFKGLATIEPLAKTDDNLPFLLKTYGTLQDAYDGTCYQYRGAKVA